MRNGLGAAILAGVITLEFFLLACSLVVLGLASFVGVQRGAGAGWVLVVQAWPLLLATVMVLLAGLWARTLLRSRLDR